MQMSRNSKDSAEEKFKMAEIYNIKIHHECLGEKKKIKTAICTQTQHYK